MMNCQSVLAPCLFLFAFGAINNAQAQLLTPVVQHVGDCENRWVLIGPPNAQTRKLGFLYVDPGAGFTLRSEGDVATDDKGTLVRQPNELDGKASVIVRIGDNRSLVCLDAAQVEALGFPVRPDWLDNYADSRTANEHEVSWGSHYNGIGDIPHALEFLLRAQKAGETSESLWFELGYAYNASGEFAKAEAVLKPAVDAHGKNSLLLGELAYAKSELHDFRSAITFYKRAIDVFHDGEADRRPAYAQNLAVTYCKLGDAVESAKWSKKGNEWREKAALEMGVDAQPVLAPANCANP
ncbi:MAG: tetratricopeptide repeat protein [Tahibacter sp.]